MTVARRIAMFAMGVVVWFAVFMLGQWLAAVTGIASAVAHMFFVWRILIIIAIVIAVSALLDKVWRPARYQGRWTSGRWTAREYADAATLAFFVGAGTAR
jgi:hypothetical protein